MSTLKRRCYKSWQHGLCKIDEFLYIVFRFDNKILSKNVFFFSLVW